MLVSFGLGNPVGVATGGATRIVELIHGNADLAPKAGVVPNGLTGVVKSQAIKGILSKKDVAKIIGKPIKGAIT